MSEAIIEVDAPGLMQRLEDAGGRLEFDGWSNPHLFGKAIPQDLIDELKTNRLALVYWAILQCPSNCPVCGGVSHHEHEGYQFCTEHDPNCGSLHWNLAHVAIARLEVMASLKEARSRSDADAITKLESQATALADEQELLEKTIKETPNGKEQHASARVDLPADPPLPERRAVRHR